MSAAEVLALHQPLDDGFGCAGCSWHSKNWSVTDDAEFAAHQLDEIKAAGYALVQLPKRPSEYWGPQHQPQWNHYPFTRVDGGEIEIGARSEHVYRVNVAEARIFAGDILAAVAVIESLS